MFSGLVTYNLIPDDFLYSKISKGIKTGYSRPIYSGNFVTELRLRPLVSFHTQCFSSHCACTDRSFQVNRVIQLHSHITLLHDMSRVYDKHGPEEAGAPPPHPNYFAEQYFQTYLHNQQHGIRVTFRICARGVWGGVGAIEIYFTRVQHFKSFCYLRPLHLLPKMSPLVNIRRQWCTLQRAI